MAAPARAGDDARTFIDKVYKRSSWQDMQSEMRLVLTSKQGEKSTREMRIWSKKNAKDESRMLMRFLAPADVRGMAFLHIENTAGDDDRRLYLAARRKVKRIAASGSGGNFMRSDFTYYDIGRPKLRDWKHTFGADQKVLGVSCRSVEGVAASPQVVNDTRYSKVVWFVDPARMIVLAADYYDKDGKRFKRLESTKIELISGVPFATHMEMTNLLTGHKSALTFVTPKTNVGISDSKFTERELRKRNY